MFLFAGGEEKESERKRFQERLSLSKHWGGAHPPGESSYSSVLMTQAHAQVRSKTMRQSHPPADSHHAESVKKPASHRL